MKFAALLATAASLAYAEVIKGQHTFDFGVHLMWETDTEAETFTLTSAQADKSYFGVILGSESMSNTDCIMFLANGASSKAVDYHSSNFGVSPTPDASNDVTSTLIDNSDGIVIMKAVRKLDTKDAKDFVIPGGDKWELGYAYNPSYSGTIMKHTRAGEIYINANGIFVTLGASFALVMAALF